MVFVHFRFLFSLTMESIIQISVEVSTEILEKKRGQDAPSTCHLEALRKEPVRSYYRAKTRCLGYVQLVVG